MCSVHKTSGIGVVSVLVADLSNVSRETHDLEAEDAAELVGLLLSTVLNVLSRFECRIDRIVGNEVMAVFGVPHAHEDDAIRAVQAALAVRDEIIGLGLHVGIGINTGQVYFGPVGTDEHPQPTVVGPVVELAARLKAEGGNDEIFVGEASYRQARRSFQFEPLRLAIKGFDEPVTGYRVIQALLKQEKARGLEGMQTELIGREEELGKLKGALAKVCSGSGQMVSIIGEAGLGKSRLVTEFKLHLPSVDMRPMEGRCTSAGTSVPYFLFADLLTDYLAISVDDTAQDMERRIEREMTLRFHEEAAEIAPVIGKLLSVRGGESWAKVAGGLNAEQLKQRIFLSVKRLVETVAQQQPLILILEDLHWADDLSLDLISFLMELLVSTPVMLLCTYRPEREHRSWRIGSQASGKCLDSFTEIQLMPLGRTETGALLQQLLSRAPLPEAVREAVIRKTCGNPLFVEELVRSLIDTGEIRRTGDGWQVRPGLADVHVPETVQGIILARIDRLSEGARFVLQSAAVIGKVFRHKLLCHITREEERIDAFLLQLQEKDFIYEERAFPEEEYSFRHVLAQEAAYRTILAKRRKDLHRRIGEGYEQLYGERREDLLEELAYHFGNGDDDRKAVKYLILAGEKAASMHANETALTRLKQALERGASGADYYRILSRRGAIYLEQWKGDMAARDYEELLEWSKKRTEPRDELDARFGLARAIYIVSFDSPDRSLEAKDLLKKAFRVAEALDDMNTMLKILTDLNTLDGSLGVLTPEERLIGSRRRLELARNIGAEEGSIAHLEVLHLEGLHGETGKLERKIIEDYQSAHKLTELKEFYWSLMWHHLGEGNVDRCVECCDEGIKLAGQIGAAPVMYPTLKALALMMAGRYGDAWVSLQQEVADQDHVFGAVFREYGTLRYRLAVLDYRGAWDGFTDMITGDRFAGREWLRRSARKFRAFAGLSVGEAVDSVGIDEVALADAYGNQIVLAEIELRNGAAAEAARRIENLCSLSAKETRENDQAQARELELRIMLQMDRTENVIAAAPPAVVYAEDRGYLPLMWRMNVSAAAAFERIGDTDRMREEYQAAADIIRTLAAWIYDPADRGIFFADPLVAETLRQSRAKPAEEEER